MLDKRCFFGLLISLGCSLLGPGNLAQAEDPPLELVQRLLDRHCGACHGPTEPKEGLQLTAAAEGQLPAALRDIQSLDSIIARLRSQTMPPPDGETKLGEEQRQTIISGLDARIDAMLGDVSNPGRVTIRRLTKVDYRNTVRDLLGIDFDTSGFPSDDIAHGFDNLADVISLPPLLMEEYLRAAESLSRTWVAREIGDDASKQPSADQSGVSLAEGALLPLMERAYRRPTSEAERGQLLAFYRQNVEKGFSHNEALQACLMRVLVSPPFLYRIERDGPIGQDRQLDDFELAARLSYFLWSSMPDDELLELARRGQLQEDEQLKKQIERMLRDPKLRQGLVENFAGQWLQTQRLEAIRPDDALFPSFDEALRSAMEEETLRLFETVIREDRPITELLDADFTFVNRRLAEHYGYGWDETSREQSGDPDPWRRVSLEGTPRRGVLTHAGLLAINSHPTRTSPVLRGKWIMEAILGTPPPPPVADAGDLEAVELKGTLRQRLEVHRENQRCAACHDQMDALGLAFENFDPLGLWRIEDEGLPIDASGELPDGSRFANAVELVDVLRTKYAAPFRKNLAEKMLVYALGRTLGMYDRLPARRIVSKVAAGDDRFSVLVLAVVQSDVFRYRRNPGRIGIEQLAEHFVSELSGNPDQQSILRVRANPRAAQPQPATGTARFELHTLKPLLAAATASGKQVAVGAPQGGPQKNEPYRYPITAPLEEPIYLSFLKGMIGPNQYSVDFLKPIKSFQETDISAVIPVANSSHSWTGSLSGPGNIRPGSLVAFDFDVRLVAKEKDSLDVYLATPGGTNRSMFASGGAFQVEGEGVHRLTRVSRRKPTTHDAWNNGIQIVLRTQTQTVVGNVSPLRVIRPMLGLSDRAEIRFENLAKNETAESPQRQIFNAQRLALVDHQETVWNSILYGTARMEQDPKRAYLVTTQHVGLELIGKDADRFRLVGENAVHEGRGLLLEGQDGEPGLQGGPEPEAESFRVRFQGADQPGRYEATLRIVTQAGGEGVLSTGKQGEPLAGLTYVDIAVTAEVK